MGHKNIGHFLAVLSSVVLSLVLAIFAVGCVTEEKITPAFPIERLEDQVNRGSPLTFFIPIQRVPVQDEFSTIGSIGHIGGAFRRLAEMIADVSIERGQTGVLDLDPIEYDLKDLDGVDFAFVKEVLLQNVHIVMDEDTNPDHESATAPNFAFIKSLEVYIKINDATGATAPIVATTSGSGSGEGKALVDANTLPERYKGALLALSYYKGISDLSCAGKCFDMTVHQGNWKQVLKNNRRVTLYVHLVLDHAPKFSFSFGGHLLLRVLVDLNGI
ncbi:MAG: hypothetical protein HYV97_00870 [Bdellovibrio sp.]|nr:hypothetical protein [Bdellovibrio sp.]